MRQAPSGHQSLLRRRATVSWPKSFVARANHPRHLVMATGTTGNIAAAFRPKVAKSWQRERLCPLFPLFKPMVQGSSLGGDAGPVVDLGAGPPVHVDETRRLLDPSQPRADRRKCREVVIAAVGDMGVAVERDIGDC